MRVLLDTHTILWWQADTGRLSGVAERIIGSAELLMISPLSCWEIATLARQGRVMLDRGPAAWIGSYRTVRLVGTTGATFVGEPATPTLEVVGT